MPAREPMSHVDTALGGQALIMRIHHCIADGIALVGVILSMTDESAPLPNRHLRIRERAGEEDDLFWRTIWRPITDAVMASINISGKLWQKSIELLANPGQALDYARIGAGIATELAKLALMPNDSPTRFKGKPGTSKRVVWSDPMPLPEVKAVGKVLCCSVNDLLLSAAAGAMRAYLVAHGDPVDGVEIRAMVPVNMRRPKDVDKLGNCFGLVGPCTP